MLTWLKAGQTPASPPPIIPSSHVEEVEDRRKAEPRRALPIHLILCSHSLSLLISFTTSPPSLLPPPQPPTLEVHKSPWATLSQPAYHPTPSRTPNLLRPSLLQQEAPSFLSPGPVILWGCESDWTQRLIECWITLSRVLSLCLIVAAAEKRTDTNGVWISMCVTTQRKRQQNMDWRASRR